MGFQSVPESVTLNDLTLNGVTALILRYFVTPGGFRGRYVKVVD